MRCATPSLMSASVAEAFRTDREKLTLSRRARVPAPPTTSADRSAADPGPSAAGTCGGRPGRRAGLGEGCGAAPGAVAPVAEGRREQARRTGAWLPTLWARRSAGLPELASNQPR